MGVSGLHFFYLLRTHELYLGWYYTKFPQINWNLESFLHKTFANQLEFGI